MFIIKDDLAKYRDDTRVYFGRLIREVFGSNPSSKLVTGDEVLTKLCEMSLKIKETPQLLHLTWWWRGSSNDSLGSFDIQDGFLYMDGDRIKVKEIFVQISPIPRYDFLLFNIEGEQKQDALIRDYDWKNGELSEESEIDLNQDTFYFTSVLSKINENMYAYKLPYNFIITAKFGAPNLKFFSDDRLEKMLNKHLFGLISYDEFTEWYNTPLMELKKMVDDFYQHLVEYPMLGLDHKLGKTIFKNVDKWTTIHIKDKIFYRARELKQMSPHPETGMWNPPVGQVQIAEGRYNHYAKSYLYLADDEETVFKEVIPQWHKTCSMAKFNVLNLTNVLDLRRIQFYNDTSDGLILTLLHYMLVYEGTISKKVENELIKNEYLVTRFLADCVRRKGFNGVIFNSTKNPNGSNLVIFKPDSMKEIGWIKMEGETYLYSI